MSVRLKCLPRSLPAFARKILLAELFSATAEAFHCQAPEFRKLPVNECLLTYALFTRQQAEKALRNGTDLASIEDRLTLNTAALGQKLRKWFGLNSQQDVLELAQILYRAIGIEVESNNSSELIVRRCFFCRFYSPAVCGLISALDEGMFSGLSGGRQLVFTHRITEGSAHCLATLQPKENVQ